MARDCIGMSCWHTPGALLTYSSSSALRGGGAVIKKAIDVYNNEVGQTEGVQNVSAVRDSPRACRSA
jgi:hypothetical protein